MKNALRMSFLLLITSTVVSAQNSTSDQSKPSEIGVCIVGEVRRPACITVKKKIGLIEALAMAGGLTEKAAQEIVVNRKDPNSALMEKLSFKLKELQSARANPDLENGDIVLVPIGAGFILDERIKIDEKKRRDKFLEPLRDKHNIPPFKFAPGDV